MINCLEIWPLSPLSYIYLVVFRLLEFALFLSLLFYFGVAFVSDLVLRVKPHPQRHEVPFLILYTGLNTPLLSNCNSPSSLLSENSLASLALIVSLHALQKPRNASSPTPDGSDCVPFDRRVFYLTLNNSSQYLRRDSFAQ